MEGGSRWKRRRRPSGQRRDGTSRTRCGPRLEDGVVGAACVWRSTEGGWTGRRFQLGKNKEVFDAEVFAIWQALRALEQRKESGRRYTVFVDSTSAITRVRDVRGHTCHGARRNGAGPSTQGSGRSVGRAGRGSGAAALAGVSRSGRAAERKRERDLFLRGDRQEVAWRGKSSLHASTPLWTTHADARCTLDRARASPGHHHPSIYRNADPVRLSDGA